MICNAEAARHSLRRANGDGQGVCSGFCPPGVRGFEEGHLPTVVVTPLIEEPAKWARFAMSLLYVMPSRDRFLKNAGGAYDTAVALVVRGISSGGKSACAERLAAV